MDCLMTLFCLMTVVNIQADTQRLGSVGALFNKPAQKEEQTQSLCWKRKWVLPHNGLVQNVHFSFDDAYAVTTGGKQAHVWKVEDGTHLFPPLSHTADVFCAQFSPDGKYVVTGAGYPDSSVRIFEVKNGELSKRRIYQSSIFSATFSSDSRLVAFASDNVAYVWNLEDNTVKELKGHTDTVVCVNFNADATLLVSAGQDAKARIWDVKTGALKYTLSGHTAAINDACFSPSGEYVGTASDDTKGIIWRAKNGEKVRELIGHGVAVYAIRFSYNNQYIVTASNDVKLWKLYDETFKKELPHDDSVRAAFFSYDNRYIATASQDQKARIWQVPSGNLLQTLSDHTGTVWSARFSRNNNYLVTASSDRTAIIWESSCS